MEVGFIKELVIVFAVAVAVVTILGRVGVPAIAGYILAGVLVGPFAFSLVPDPEQVRTMAEVGVALLLFGVGIELSPERISRLWRVSLKAGAVQVLLTVFAAGAIAWGFGLALGPALLVGFVISVSSTSVVLRALSQRGELETPHGATSLGILLFQDVAVAPMILALPFLAGRGDSVSAALLTLLMLLVALTAIFLVSRYLVPRFLRLISLDRRRDIFILSIFLVCFGVAGAVAEAGMSLELGAFLAGVVVSGSEYRHQALSDLIPMREVFASVFFVSIGMLLDIQRSINEAGEIILILAAIIIGKALIIFVASWISSRSNRVSAQSALNLCQVGEFGFVVLSAASEYSLLPFALEYHLTVAIILSMALTPAFIALGERISGHVALVAKPGPETMKGISQICEKDHVIIAGYGVIGKEIARTLKSLDANYVIADLNPREVRVASAAGEPIIFADVSAADTLEALGLKRATEFIIAINDPSAAFRAVSVARQVSKDVRIIVRVKYLMDVAAMKSLGATVVIAEELESAARILELTLTRMGLPTHEVERRKLQARQPAH